MGKKTVLIVDDSLSMRTFIKDSLTHAGYEVIGEAINGEQAINMAFQYTPDFVTLDNILPDMLGLDVLKVFKKEGLKSQTIVISAIGQDNVVEEGLEFGAVAYIVKPFTVEKLVAELKKL